MYISNYGIIAKLKDIQLPKPSLSPLLELQDPKRLKIGNVAAIIAASITTIITIFITNIPKVKSTDGNVAGTYCCSQLQNSKKSYCERYIGYFMFANICFIICLLSIKYSFLIFGCHYLIKFIHTSEYIVIFKRNFLKLDSFYGSIK